MSSPNDTTAENNQTYTLDAAFQPVTEQQQRAETLSGCFIQDVASQPQAFNPVNNSGQESHDLFENIFNLSTSHEQQYSEMLSYVPEDASDWNSVQMLGDFDQDILPAYELAEPSNHNVISATVTAETAAPQGLSESTNNNWLHENITAGSTALLDGFGESNNSDWVSRATNGVPSHLPSAQTRPSNNNNLVIGHISHSPPRPRRGRPASTSVAVPSHLSTGQPGASKNRNLVSEHINPSPPRPSRGRPPSLVRATSAPSHLLSGQTGPSNNNNLLSAIVTGGTAAPQGLGESTNNNWFSSTVTSGNAAPQGLGESTNDNWVSGMSVFAPTGLLSNTTYNNLLPANITACSADFRQGFGESINNNNWVAGTPFGVPSHLPVGQPGPSNNSNLVSEHVNPSPPRPRRGRPRSTLVRATSAPSHLLSGQTGPSNNNNHVIGHVNPSNPWSCLGQPPSTSVSRGTCGHRPPRPLSITSNNNNYRVSSASPSSGVLHISQGQIASSSNNVPEMHQINQEQTQNPNRQRSRDITAEEIDEQIRKRRCTGNGEYGPLYRAFHQDIDPFCRSLLKIQDLEQGEQKPVQGQKRGEDPNNGPGNQHQ